MFCSEVVSYLATLNVTTFMENNMLQYFNCFPTDTMGIYRLSMDYHKALQINFTCSLNLHAAYNGKLFLIFVNKKGGLQLETETYKVLVNFGELR